MLMSANASKRDLSPLTLPTMAEQSTNYSNANASSPLQASTQQLRSSTPRAPSPIDSLSTNEPAVSTQQQEQRHFSNAQSLEPAMRIPHVTASLRQAAVPVSANGAPQCHQGFTLQLPPPPKLQSSAKSPGTNFVNSFKPEPQNNPQNAYQVRTRALSLLM